MGSPLYPLQKNLGGDSTPGWLDLLWRRFRADSDVVVVTANYTVAAEVAWVRANATSGTFTVTVPLAKDYPARTIGVIKTDSGTNFVTVARSGSDTINGASSRKLSVQYHKILLKSDGISAWDIVQWSASGTYTPTLTNVTNLDGSTAFECQYCATNSMVTVSGKFAADPTAAAPTATELGISLPIASTTAAEEDLGGVAFTGSNQQGARILADTANNRAKVAWSANDTSNRNYSFIFMYQII